MQPQHKTSINRLIVVTLVIAVIALIGSHTGRADNYGGVSKTHESQMKALIYKHFGTGWLGREMVCIARRESGLNPRAANYRDSNGGSYGLFQMNGIHRWRNESLSEFQRRMWNPTTHMQAVVRLARGGLGPWLGGC